MAKKITFGTHEAKRNEGSQVTKQKPKNNGGRGSQRPTESLHTSQTCPQKRDMEKGKPDSAPQHQTQQAEGLPAKEGRNRKGRLKKEKSLGGKAC